MDSRDSSPNLAPRLLNLDSCPICDCKNLDLELRVQQWTLRKCRNCEIVFTSPRLLGGEISSIYEEKYYEQSSDYFKLQMSPPSSDHRALAKMMGKRVSCNHPKSLDVGTGAGQLVAAFSEQGFLAIGTELNKMAAMQAREMGRDVRSSTIDNFATDEFQVVTAMHVLEHIPNPQDFVQEISRITAPGGWVVVEVPNYGCQASMKLRERWKPLYPDTHLFQFTEKTLRMVLRRSGLRVDRVQRLGGAGVMNSLAPASEAPTSPSVTPASLAGNSPHLRRALVERLKIPARKIPGIQQMFRWFNWELLGHGEYIRVYCRKQ